MFDLMWKDFITARWLLALVVPFYLVQLATFSSSAPMFYLATIIFSALLGFGSIVLEDHQNTEILWCSLPVARREIVLGRYLSTVVGMISGLVLSWSTGMIISVITRAGSEIPASLAAPWIQATMFTVMVLLAAGFLPCYFRFGAGRGFVVFAALTIGTVIVLSLAAPLALYLAGYASLLADHELMREMAANVDAKEKARLAHAVIVSLAVLASIVLLISAGLSVRFYDRRDL